MVGMTMCRARSRLVPSALFVGILVSAVFVVAWGAPAGADVTAPPGVTLAAGQSIWFSINPPTQTSGQDVTLSVAGGNVGPADVWGPTGSWPGTWSADGITLQQAGSTPCPTSDSSCSFTISGSASGPVLFGAGPLAQQAPQQTIDVQPPPTTTTTTSPPTTTPPGPDPTFTLPQNGLLTGPNQFVFTVKNVELGVTYQWTLTNNGTAVNSVPNSTTYSPPPQIFTQPGTYTLTMTATAAGRTASTQQSTTFLIQPSNPTPPPNNPMPTPQPPAAAPAGSGPAPVARPGVPGLATGLHAVSYVPQLANFTTPTRGAVQPVTVIWLWRPDWFQPSSDPPRLVKTGGRPGAVKRADVSIDPRKGGPSAAPLLAGLAAFGIFGAGWVMFKRRQVRSSLLD
jgi:surface-anchored protein